MIDTNRLALGIHPNSVLSVKEMVECARLAEAKDFAATWVAEGHRGDVFALLSALAMSTSKIRLGAGILPVLVRWVVAMGATAVDEISGGRFMLGLGAGHKSIIEDWHGLAYDRPTQKMREVTEIVRRALTVGVVDFDGEAFNIKSAQLSLRPIRPDVPFGLLVGLNTTVGALIMVVGPSLFGLAYDLSGSYAASLCLCIGLQLASSLIILCAPRVVREPVGVTERG